MRQIVQRTADSLFLSNHIDKSNGSDTISAVLYRALVGAEVALTLTLATAGCGGGSSGGNGGGGDNGGQAPVMEPIADQTVVFGSDLLIAVSASDPEGEPVTLSTSDLPENS